MGRECGLLRVDWPSPEEVEGRRGERWTGWLGAVIAVSLARILGCHSLVPPSSTPRLPERRAPGATHPDEFGGGRSSLIWVVWADPSATEVRIRSDAPTRRWTRDSHSGPTLPPELLADPRFGIREADIYATLHTPARER